MNRRRRRLHGTALGVTADSAARHWLARVHDSKCATLTQSALITGSSNEHEFCPSPQSYARSKRFNSPNFCTRIGQATKGARYGAIKLPDIARCKHTSDVDGPNRDVLVLIWRVMINWLRAFPPTVRRITPSIIGMREALLFHPRTRVAKRRSSSPVTPERFGTNYTLTKQHNVKSIF